MKKIIDLYLLINHKDLYDYRYEKNIIKEHPYILSIKDKLKEKTNLFEEYLININKILSTIFFIFIQIQISNNFYKINFNNRINLINSDNSWKYLYVSDDYKSININVLIFIESMLKSMIKKIRMINYLLM